MTNTKESVPLPADLSVPGAVYCAKADCTAEAAGFAAGTAIPSSSTASTGRLDPPYYQGMEGWAGLTGHSNYIEFGKAPFAACPPACATVTVYSRGSHDAPRPRRWPRTAASMGRSSMPRRVPLMMRGK